MNPDLILFLIKFFSGSTLIIAVIGAHHMKIGRSNKSIAMSKEVREDMEILLRNLPPDQENLLNKSVSFYLNEEKQGSPANLLIDQLILIIKSSFVEKEACACSSLIRGGNIQLLESSTKKLHQMFEAKKR